MPNGMILAAGRGTRLGPLTDELPKPLLPVANLPVMTQGLRCLRAAGITRVGINLHYRAEQILRAFGDGRDHGVALHWLVEEGMAHGTAGGVKAMQPLLDGDQVVIIAGDAMVDVDLAPLLAAHRASGAFASLATLTVADPSHYGVVVAESDGRIRAFQEKPAKGTAISHEANTGIYVFEPGIFDYIPADTFYDFANHVFPQLLAEGKPFYAFPVKGYWTDIGHPGDYLQSNLDFLAGRMSITSAGRRVGSSLVGDGAVVDGVTLSQCVIGAGAVLAPGAVLDRCVVWPESRLAVPQRLANSILTPWGAYVIDGPQVRALALVG